MHIMQQNSLRRYGCAFGDKGALRKVNMFCPSNSSGRQHQVVTVRAVKGTKATAAKGFGAPKSKGIAADAPCPCGSGALYEACCSRYHIGPASPPTPEALLRARYSAYVSKDPTFITATTNPNSPEYTGSRASYLSTVKQTMRRLDPLGITLLAQEPGTAGGEDEAFITFRLKRRIRDPEAKGVASEVDELTERSHFVRFKGCWTYLNSEFVEEPGVQGVGADKAATGVELPKSEEKKKGFFNFF